MGVDWRVILQTTLPDPRQVKDSQGTVGALLLSAKLLFAIATAQRGFTTASVQVTTI